MSTPSTSPSAGTKSGCSTRSRGTPTPIRLAPTGRRILVGAVLLSIQRGRPFSAALVYLAAGVAIGLLLRAIGVAQVKADDARPGIAVGKVVGQGTPAQLRRMKWWASGLFLLMLAIYALSSILEPRHPALFYVTAFTEAAMVGQPIYAHVTLEKGEGLPDYFKKTRDLDIKESWIHLVTIYVIVTVLSIFGGWVIGYLNKQGWTITRARKTGMFVFALCVIPIFLVAEVGEWGAVLLIGLAGAAHQAWSANLYTTVSDMFPKKAVASVIGIGTGAVHDPGLVDYIERAYDDAKYGQISKRPYLDMIFPSMIDPDMAPPGQHVMSIFVQYAPYALNGGWTDAKREAFGNAVVKTLARHAPNIESLIVGRQVLTPADIERVTGLTEGNIFQGELALHQLFFLRPVPGWSRYRTPIRGFWQCGAGTHPGGGIMGASGRIAAMEIVGG